MNEEIRKKWKIYLKSDTIVHVSDFKYKVEMYGMNNMEENNRGGTKGKHKKYSGSVQRDFVGPPEHKTRGQSLDLNH